MWFIGYASIMSGLIDNRIDSVRWHSLSLACPGSGLHIV